MSIDQSPFQVTHLSQLEEEIEEYDQTIQKNLKMLTEKQKQIEEQRIMTSVEKAKNPKINDMQEDDQFEEIFDPQRLFRESSGDALINGYKYLNSDDVMKSIETYINSDIKDDDKSLEKLLSSLELDTSLAPKNTNKEAVELISSMMEMNSPNITNEIWNLVDSQQILDVHTEVLSLDQKYKKSLYESIDLFSPSLTSPESASEIDARFASVDKNLYEENIRAKVGMHVHGIEVKHVGVNKEGLRIELNIKGKVHLKLITDREGNLGKFSNRLTHNIE
jgi:hypothetical protein